jgi:hypothetical protein
LQKARCKKLNKNLARAPQEFRLSFFASQNKQVQKKHRNSEEPPFAIRGAGDTLADVEKNSSCPLRLFCVRERHRMAETRSGLGRCCA